PSLGMAFWLQAQLAIIIAFIFMGIIVFVIFRTFIPSIAVIMSAMSDILITLAFMQVFGIELSLAGLAALLMLVGYSVDTDIMLTSRLLRESEEKTLADKMKRALKTGLTMTFTSIGALAALLLSAISPVLSQIAMVLLIGLSFDIMNTWLMNSVILRWYCEKRGLI
ncbi:MAG: preprotein translocase subunit SecF, partial [Candidatus Aenigmarchaeota archaeon]|nr:preprotein translocase subunit SecF [Candidatus Aenigmarchaeota archaeon]